jgi:hypothetical protein
MRGFMKAMMMLIERWPANLGMHGNEIENCTRNTRAIDGATGYDTHVRDTMTRYISKNLRRKTLHYYTLALPSPLLNPRPLLFICVVPFLLRPFYSCAHHPLPSSLFTSTSSSSAPPLAHQP